MDTRTGRFSGVSISGANLPGCPFGRAASRCGYDLLALGLKRLQFFRKPRVFGFQIIICLDGRVSLLPQLRHKIDGSKDALLQALERVYVFGSWWLLLPCSPAPGFLADATGRS